MNRHLYKLLFLAACLPGLSSIAQPTAASYPFQNTTLSFEERVNDLVGRLTLEEKVAQMLDATPAIERLGIPRYDWWNEVLHGVARTTYRVTVYPQAIGMAATWDSNSIRRMGDYSALEGRAVYNRSLTDGNQGLRYTGLTYWTPNINIFRDPRWGRGQETYGEDPFLTATMGKAFVRGLQGNDPKYLKAAACAKHFAVHSGPEPSRHAFNATTSKYDLWNTYLPAFKELVTKADVAGVMCAYNALDGQPCCGNDLLMVDILRKQWNFTGYVTSDCGAIDDFFNFHKTHPDATSAAADALLHGTDVDCGNVSYKTLVQAVKTGKLTEQQIDVSLRRLFLIRFRLGFFDPSSMVKWAQTPAGTLESPEHKALALKMAQQSIVLLKNEHHTLPLKKNIRKIAVIGPNADNKIAVLGNYNGTPSTIVSALQGIREKLGTGTEIIYEKAINFTNDTLLADLPLQSQYSMDGQQGWRAEYYDNTKLDGNAILSRMEPELDHRWQEREIIAGTKRASFFSARFTTRFTAAATGTLLFELEGDDGYRFSVDGRQVVDAWNRNRWGAKTYRLATEAGKTYELKVEYYQNDWDAVMKLRAGNFAKTDFTALARRVQDADAIVFVGGISPQLEGEEMPVNYPGFNGGDRTSILLPAVQTELMQALQGTGKPVVFVMMTGSAIAAPWEAAHVPAIVNAWYGGQSAGTAIADVLFGDYNPAGRLPVTFYAADKDLPDFDSYSMTGRTYRYFKGTPLWPFGYGLSYTSFRYDQLQYPPAAVRNKSVPVAVRVTNTGRQAGEEVVQLYVSGKMNNGMTTPIRQLKGFRRIFLKAGESSTIRFQLLPEDLSLMNDEGRAIPYRKVNISVGGGQPATGSAAAQTVSGTIRLPSY